MKKHIRFLTGALSLVLALSLCAPALAAEGQYTVGGESVPTIPAGADPEDYWTLDVQDLLDAAMDPSYIDISLTGEEQAAIEEYMDSLSGSQDWWEQPEHVTLYVGGELLATDGDGVLTVVDGVSYVDVATLNAILGTELEGDKLPVRAAADAAGWDVVWNPNTYEAILVDRESVMAALEEKLGGLDLILGKLRELNPPEGKSLRTESEGTLTFTQFNTLDGDATVKAGLQLEALQRDGITNETLSYEAEEVLALIPDSLRAAMEHDLSKADAAHLDELLGKGSISIIQNPEEGTMWVNFPALALLDKTIGEDAWIAQAMEETVSADTSLAEAAYQNLLNQLAEDDFWGAGYVWEDFMEDLDGLKPVGKATLNADGLTWTLDTASANAAAAESMGEGVALFKECEIDFHAAPSGKVSLALAIRLDMDGIAAAGMSQVVGGNSSYAALAYSLMNGMPDFRLTYRMEADGKTTTENMELHVKNQYELALEFTGAVTETADRPLTMPPEGAQIIENDPV